ncbi:hypothetical protein [Streptomyces collinus]
MEERGTAAENLEDGFAVEFWCHQLLLFAFVFGGRNSVLLW